MDFRVSIRMLISRDTFPRLIRNTCGAAVPGTAARGGSPCFLPYTFVFSLYTMMRRGAVILIGVVNLNLEKKVANSTVLWWGKAVFEHRSSTSLYQGP